MNTTTDEGDFTYDVVNEDWSELKKELEPETWQGLDFPEEFKSQLPWFNEILWDDELHEHEGYYFRAIRMTGGYWTGYVYIPKNHPLYGKTYSDDPEIDKLSVHGGITYNALHGDVYVLGFDTSHGRDFAPASKCRSLREFIRACESYKGHQYVVEQAKGLINDIRRKYS